jgi:hypothetical protein
MTYASWHTTLTHWRISQKIKPIRVEGLRLVRCTTHFIFCGGRVQGNISCTEQREATPMTFMKPLNLLVVCAAFVFLGAIVFGLL